MPPVSLFAKEAEFAEDRESALLSLKFFRDALPFARPLMLSFPIMTFPFKPSQLLCDRHQIEAGTTGEAPPWVATTEKK